METGILQGQSLKLNRFINMERYFLHLSAKVMVKFVERCPKIMNVNCYLYGLKTSVWHDICKERESLLTRARKMKIIFRILYIPSVLFLQGREIFCFCVAMTHGAMSVSHGKSLISHGGESVSHGERLILHGAKSI